MPIQSLSFPIFPRTCQHSIKDSQYLMPSLGLLLLAYHGLTEQETSLSTLVVGVLRIPHRWLVHTSMPTSGFPPFQGKGAAPLLPAVSPLKKVKLPGSLSPLRWATACGICLFCCRSSIPPDLSFHVRLVQKSKHNRAWTNPRATQPCMKGLILQASSLAKGHTRTNWE